jgi:hypothetical protein
MIALAIASCVHWGKSGNSQLWLNWVEGQASSGSAIARQIFDGFCLGMLGLTGIECEYESIPVPSTRTEALPSRFSIVYRPHQTGAISPCFAKPASASHSTQYAYDNASAGYGSTKDDLAGSKCLECSCPDSEFYAAIIWRRSWQPPSRQDGG